MDYCRIHINMELRELLLYVTLTLSLMTQTNGQRPCETPNGNRGECISIYDCPVLHDLLVNSVLIRNTTTNFQSFQCSSEPNEGTFVCCKLSQEENVRPNQIKAPSYNRGNLINICGCQGYRRSIIERNETDLNEFPWMALLDYEDEENHFIPFCGGFLINARYVVTTAYCVKGNRKNTTRKIVNIRIGEYDTTTNPDCVNDGFQDNCNFPILNYGIEEVISHEDYSPLNYQNDIALIRLTGNVVYNEFAFPICLPEPDFPGTPDGNEVTVAGWGLTLDRELSSVKLKAKTSVVSFNRCLDEYSTQTNLSKKVQMCAGGEFLMDACVVDSSGPLMARYNGSWIAEGLASFGRRCGVVSPIVYTRISAYVLWILGNMKP
ncbi:CLIP domain-containing serine protease B9-like [Phlebotomus papatasi]|uniref:CLIP domain-containing serine protease B9-like n=1 Tax=Phlebotomus papatasi TaxID=29031 RepID=UPI0024841FD1|nr:CLIP domain-containing serine protease B9-like [Phlebotomus papatasi]